MIRVEMIEVLIAGGVEDLFPIELSLPALLVITSESANLS